MTDALRILVVDDDQRMAKTLADILRVKGYEAETAHSGSGALEKIASTSFTSTQDRPSGSEQSFGAAQDRPFDCVLSDIKMPEINGVELYRAIKAERPNLPVVLMTAYSSDSLVKEGLEEGVIAALSKPLDIGLLLTFFSFLRKERSIVIVDDDPEFCQTLGDILQMQGFAVTRVTDPDEVIGSLQADGAVVLLDMKLGGINGLTVLHKIREQHPHLPVVLVTGYREEMSSSIEAALKVGAFTCLYKPFEVEQILGVLSEVHRQQLGTVFGGQGVRSRK